jgi:hypothetical protein
VLSDRLIEAFDAATADPPRPVDVRRVVVRAKRRRRRRRAVLSASLAVVLAAVTVAVAGLAGGGSDRSRLTPASTPAVTLETFAGVDITALPEGVKALGGPDVTGPLAGNVYGLTQKFTGVKQPDKYLPPTLTVTVENARPNLDSYAQSQKSNARWVEISGQRALLVTYTAINAIPPSHAPGTPMPTPAASDLQLDSQLYWNPSPTSALTLLVEGQAGITLDETLAVARGLVVDPKGPTQPTDRTAADAEIRQVFQAAFTGGTPLAEAEAGIQNGQGLTSTLNHLKALHPETADNTTISVKSISYYDADHALVAIDLKYQFGTSHLEGSFWIGALLLDGHWKVSRANYCETISLTSVSCPKS